MAERFSISGKDFKVSALEAGVPFIVGKQRTKYYPMEAVQICGRPCDYEDYTVDGDIFIAGNWYPSIDHVIPVSKGGRHSWDNVKLAHRLCNTVKSNKL